MSALLLVTVFAAALARAATGGASTGDDDDDVALPVRMSIACSPRGELWHPAPGELLDPSGRWLRLQKSAASELAPAADAPTWSLDLESPTLLVPGEPWRSGAAPIPVAPALFPLEPAYVDASTPHGIEGGGLGAARFEGEVVDWVGTVWSLAVEKRPGPGGERRIQLRHQHRSAVRPLGVLCGARSVARLDAARRRVLIAEHDEATLSTELLWLPLDGKPKEGLPLWIEGDEAAARARALAEDRLVFVHLRIPHRALAEFMETRALGDERVRAEILRSFVPLKLDAGLERERFEKLFGERGALGSAVLAADGDAIAVLKGFAEPEVLLAFLARAEALHSKWSERRERHRECPSDEAAQLAFALARIEGEDFVGSEPLLLRLLCAAEPQVRARSHLELANLEMGRGRVIEAQHHLGAYHRLAFDRRESFALDGVRSRASYLEALIARARRKPWQAARVLEESLVADSDFVSPELLLELSLAWHEEGEQELGKRGLETIAYRYAGSLTGNQAEACLQHMSVPHGH